MTGKAVAQGTKAGSANSRILVQSIQFGEKPFRKLKDMCLPIAKRITLLCGHNGVGKSTVLGMLASTSGLSKGSKEGQSPKSYKSYFGKNYEANVNEILFIDHAKEVAAVKAAGNLCEPIVKYLVGGKELIKECSLTKRQGSLRARVVSRTVPHKLFIDGAFKLGPDAKLPLPTMFLGMVRMLPIGESPDSRIQNSLAVPWDKSDQEFLFSFVKAVIPGAGAIPGELAANRVKQTSKLSTHPKYPYGPRTVSLGQDSLGAIATALASFHRIKRLQGADYPGGLLIIDELDAGFHPHALDVLVSELRKAADMLDLQVVATTHSLRLIEAVHPDGASRKTAKGRDSVIYLKDTRAPKFDESMSLVDIANDMNAVLPAAARRPELKVYFEDDEAHEVYRLVTRSSLIATLQKKYDVQIKAMPLGVGCSSLALLPEKDDYFKSVVLIVDADGTRPKKIPPNLVELPGGEDATGKRLSPEQTLIRYAEALVENPKDPAWSSSMLSISSDVLHASLLGGWDFLTIDRKAAKKWWKEKASNIKRIGLYQIWAQAHAEKIESYEQQLESAVKAAAKAKRAMGWLAKSR
jgi:energy-coupling factor transporter ATP-binding protein EcfA2